MKISGGTGNDPVPTPGGGLGGQALPLPADLTSFEGRRHEIGEVKRLLGEARIVTLTGFGGVGKTRLALRAARDLARTYQDGVAWVELADLRDESLVAQAVCDALRITSTGNRDPRAMLVDYLRDRRALLVLDNCEHLLEATAALAADLLRAAPETRLLATSRQALRIPGEVILPVAPLPVPDDAAAAEPGAVTLYPAMSLLRERVAAVLPGFEITPDNQADVAELCRKLEGIPLAIELAAVKVRVLSVRELVDRLDARLRLLRQEGRTGPTRHQTIKATIDWSYELCTDDERLLWARASAFAGGFDLDAAEMVCSDDALPRDLVLEAVEGLVDKSVLTRTSANGQVRFRLLEPLREHGQVRLREAGEHHELAHRHLSWCEELVAQASMQWFGPTQERWCGILRNEHANIRAAAEHCLRHDECADRALPLLGEPWFLWVALFLDEGRHWLERALARCPSDSVARARALATAGYVAALQGDRRAAEEFVAEGRRIALAHEDGGTLAYVTHVAGLTALFHDPARSVRLLSEALERYQAGTWYDDYQAGMRIQLGLAFLFDGSVGRAREQFDICRELCEVSGERWLLSYALYGQAFVLHVDGRCDEAIAVALDALRIKHFFNDVLGMATVLDLLGWAKVESGCHEDAAFIMGVASQTWDHVGVRLFGSDSWIAHRERAAQVATETLGRERFRAAYDQGERMPQARAFAQVLGERERATSTEDLETVRLTPREREIAALVAEGLSNRAIAERLVIARRTAEGHVENILTKFGFHSRSQIAAWIGEQRGERSETDDVAGDRRPIGGPISA